jgi:hypothetical protein
MKDPNASQKREANLKRKGAKGNPAQITRAFLMRMCAAIDHIWEKHSSVPGAMENLRQSRVIRAALLNGDPIEITNEVNA